MVWGLGFLAGGVLERTIFVERIGRETNLYWIHVHVDEPA